MGRRGPEPELADRLWASAEGAATTRTVLPSPTEAARLAGVKPATARGQYRRWLDEGRLAYDEAAGVYYLPPAETNAA